MYAADRTREHSIEVYPRNDSECKTISNDEDSSEMIVVQITSFEHFEVLFSAGFYYSDQYTRIVGSLLYIYIFVSRTRSRLLQIEAQFALLKVNQGNKFLLTALKL